MIAEENVGSVNKVKYLKPEVISYAHHAFPLGMIRQNSCSEMWFVSNYIYLYSRPGENMFNFLVEYVNNPFIDMRHIYKDEFDWICQKASLEEWIKKEVVQGCAFEIMVDYYYLPSSKFYHNEHKMHEILVIGFDNDDCYYWDYVKGIYKESVCKWKEIVPHEDELLYGEGIKAKIIKPKNSTYIFRLESVVEQLKDYLESRNVYEKIALWGDHYRYRKCTYGMDCTKMLINYLNNNKYKRIDYRYINVFYEHKKCMRIRMEYISQKIVYMSKEKWIMLEREWESVLKLSLFYDIKLEKGECDRKTYAIIVEKIEKLYWLEREVLEQTIAFMEGLGKSNSIRL